MIMANYNEEWSPNKGAQSDSCSSMKQPGPANGGVILVITNNVAIWEMLSKSVQDKIRSN